MNEPVRPALPPTPGVAARVFGDRLSVAERYVAELADTGTSHGLIGPRETPRLWERHVLNCAVVAELIPIGAVCVDVGSGAGLPGLALAIARPDIGMHLVETLSRRAEWLRSTIDTLGLTDVHVHNARAEAMAGQVRAAVVTARAVADLPTLARWCFPLLDDEGRLLALKGERAQQEWDAAAEELRRLGAVRGRVVQCGTGIVEPPTLVVEVQVGRAPVQPARAARPAKHRVTRGRARG